MVLPARIGSARVGQSNIGVMYIPPVIPSELVETRLEWDLPGDHKFETGLDRGVLYVDGLDGVAWSGLTSVVISPTGGEARPLYIDGVKYLNLASSEEVTATISAYYSPEEFDLCDGALSYSPGIRIHEQVRRPFCFSFRTKTGNDMQDETGYIIHLIYNAMALPTTRTRKSLSDDVGVDPLSWKLTTRPMPFPDLQPTAYIKVDSTKTAPSIMQKLERVLYGYGLADARIPLPAELLEIFSTQPITVTDNGDGTFTVDGPDDAVFDNGDGTFTVISDGAVIIDENTFSLTST